MLLYACLGVQGTQFTASDGVYAASHQETAPAQGSDPPEGVILQECTNTNSSGDPLESDYQVECVIILEFHIPYSWSTRLVNNVTRRPLYVQPVGQLQNWETG